jgi:hypothetical protein
VEHAAGCNGDVTSSPSATGTDYVQQATYDGPPTPEELLAHWMQMFPELPRLDVCNAIRSRRGLGNEENAIFNTLTRMRNKRHKLGLTEAPTAPPPVRHGPRREPNAWDSTGNRFGGGAEPASAHHSVASVHLGRARPHQNPRPVPGAAGAEYFNRSNRHALGRLPSGEGGAIKFHVQWDYDNVPIPPNCRPADFVDAVRRYLDRESAAIRRTSAPIMQAFFTPRSRLTPFQKTALRELGVSLLECGTKANDADRQLQRHVRNLVDMNIDPSANVFVVVSGDKDFTDLANELRRKQFCVVAIHAANPGSHHERVLETLFDAAVHIDALLSAR